MFSNIYSGRRVLITGHTGFKGSWLTSWLLELGAQVAGLSIGSPSYPCNFEVLGLEERIKHFQGDVSNPAVVKEVLLQFKPEIVFHLAAQALVRRSYKQPYETFMTNAIGSLNVLEASRSTPSVRAIVVVTSDKCYQNVEWIWGYRETDRLGGDDPYSASKACAEIISHSYIKSFFRLTEGAPSVATARAGNVIGGGDWAEDRIVPDCMRSWSKNLAVKIRNPNSTRPWQHVLEPLSGYLQLGSELWQHPAAIHGKSFNFGPDSTVNEPVSKLIEKLANFWPQARWEYELPQGHKEHEANLLKLCCDQALVELAWLPTMDFTTTVQLTGEWYQSYFSKRSEDMVKIMSDQISVYCNKAKSRGYLWVK